MKEVKVMKRYKCDFCKRRSTRTAMELHEKICFRNPNRFCDNCNNTGKVIMTENGMDYKVDCHYCSRFNVQQLEEIKKRESSTQ